MEEVMVEAIDEGKIVKVSEHYAKQEGLPIIRRPEPRFKEENVSEDKEKLDPARREKRGILKFDDFRKPLRTNSQVQKELVDNFHWEISRKRRELGMSRKELGERLDIDSREAMMLERGILMKDDFILINKVQQVLGLNLRKDRVDYSQSPRKVMEEKISEDLGIEEKLDLGSGDEIELLDE